MFVFARRSEWSGRLIDESQDLDRELKCADSVSKCFALGSFPRLNSVKEALVTFLYDVVGVLGHGLKSQVFDGASGGSPHTPWSECESTTATKGSYM